jgi:predicted RNA-binding protein with PIN domain
MPYLIDGYNLLGTVRKADEQYAAMNEAGLCALLAEYLRRMRHEGRIYFDGTGPRDKAGLLSLGNLEVIFTGPGVEADHRIAEEVEQSSAPKFLAVISSDREVRASAEKRKSAAIRSEDFWPTVVKTLERKKRIREPKAKREGLTEGETDEWMRIFGLK